MERQKQILETFKGDKNLVLTKQKIKKLGNIFYWSNTDKHLGDTLSRMVNNNSLERVSKGNYRLGNGTKMIIQPENQTKLF